MINDRAWTIVACSAKEKEGKKDLRLKMYRSARGDRLADSKYRLMSPLLKLYPCIIKKSFKLTINLEHSI